MFYYSFVFYFILFVMRCQGGMAWGIGKKVGGWRSAALEVGGKGQKADDKRQRSEVRGQKTIANFGLRIAN
jgi:hypothetical protein